MAGSLSGIERLALRIGTRLVLRLAARGARGLGRKVSKIRRRRKARRRRSRNGS